jgi:hypothetical protein
MKICLFNHPEKIVTQYKITRLFRQAYEQEITMNNAISGFHKTEIYPVKIILLQEKQQN